MITIMYPLSSGLAAPMDSFGWCSWLSRTLHTREVAGSIPASNILLRGRQPPLHTHIVLKPTSKFMMRLSTLIYEFVCLLFMSEGVASLCSPSGDWSFGVWTVC